MPNTTDITRIPAPRVPFIDERTGQVSREWYRFLYNLFNLTGGGESQPSTEELEIGPTSSESSEVAELQNQLEGLALSITRPEVQQTYYGAFYDTTTQTHTVINTAKAITFDTTDISYGVERASTTSRITFYNPGVYDVQFSAQIDTTSGGADQIWIWLRKNGTDVANSASTFRIQGNNSEIVVAWDFMVEIAANDYVELMWAVDDLNVQLLAAAAAAPIPAIPSVILTVMQVNTPF